MVVNYLEAHQMRALGAPGREAMMSHLAQSEPDLAILDLRLGQDNGLDRDGVVNGDEDERR